MRKLQTPEPRLFSKLVSRAKTNKLLIFGALLLAVVAVILITFLMRSINPSHKITNKIADLSKSTITCKQVLAEIGGTTDYARYNVGARKKLLEKQVFCFSDQLQFDKAIASAQKLRAIYASENDSKNQQRMDATIQTMQNTKAALGATN